MKRGPSFDLDDTRFREFAACTEDQEPLFFPEDGTAGWCYARARQICRGCAVRMECLEFAITHGERHGMWGGCTPAEIRRIRTTRRRATAAIEVADLRPDPAARQRPSMEELIVRLAARNGMPTFPVRRATHAEMTGAEL